MTTNQIKTKPKTGRKPQYPDYISLDILDSVIKSKVATLNRTNSLN